MTAQRTKYTARAIRTDGWWALSVPGVTGAHTQARRLQQAEGVVRNLLSILLDLPENSFDVEVMPEIEERAQTALDELDQAKANFLLAQETLAAQQRRAASALVTSGLSVRDAGKLLGVSFQRVSQLTGQDGTTVSRIRPSDGSGAMHSSSRGERHQGAPATKVSQTSRRAASKKDSAR